MSSATAEVLGPPLSATGARAIGAVGVLTAAALWGTVGPAQVVAASSADPGALGVMRLLVGGVALALFVPGRGAWRAVLHSGAWRWVLLAAASTGVYQVTFMHAVDGLGAALGTVVALGVAPVATGFAARRWTGERLTLAWGVGTAAAIVGCALLLAPGAGTTPPSVASIGFALVSGACYGVYTVAAKRFVTAGAPPLPTTTITLLIAGVALTPIVAMHPEHLLAPRTIGLIAWVGFAGTTAAYAVFVHGLRHTTAATAGTLSLVEPLLAAVLGIGVLHEHLTATALAGCVVLIAGLAAVQGTFHGAVRRKPTLEAAAHSPPPAGATRWRHVRHQGGWLTSYFDDQLVRLLAPGRPLMHPLALLAEDDQQFGGGLAGVGEGMDLTGQSQNLAPAQKTLIGRYKKGTLRWREKGAGRRITDFRGRNVAAIEKRQTSFTPKLRAELAARYEAGETVKGLADAYHADKGTIIRHLVHEGVQMRRQGLNDEQAAEAKRLYERPTLLRRHGLT